jgi:hypothetical protein
MRTVRIVTVTAAILLCLAWSSTVLAQSARDRAATQEQTLQGNGGGNGNGPPHATGSGHPTGPSRPTGPGHPTGPGKPTRRRAS